MDFTEMVRKTRIKNYETAKDFHKKSKLSCSYFYYSKVESGTVPDIKLAIEILRGLKINLKTGLYAWARGQMPDKETKGFFSLIEDEALSGEQDSMERALVVNRRQAKLLESDPIYWELLLFISSRFRSSQLPENEIAKCFNLSTQKITQLMKDLYDEGLLDKKDSKFCLSKEWAFIPYEEEFNHLRDLNFKRAVSQFWKQPPQERFRTTITKPLTPAQRREVEAMVMSFINAIVDIEEVPQPKSTPITVGVFSSIRKFGND